LGAQLHDAAKKGMQMESKTPIGIFLLGGPGSGKDYVLNNIFSRFDLTEVQIEHILNGAADQLIESKQNIVINGAIDEEKMAVIKQLLEGYSFDHVFVSVTNKVSRDRNAMRTNPLTENKRTEKWYRAEKIKESLEDVFVFNNSINLNESSEMERVFFGNQIEKLLSRIVESGLEMKHAPEPKSFTLIREKKFPPVRKDKESGLPQKYVKGLSASTAKARKAHWEKTSKMSDKDPRAYEPAPGDATAKTKPSKHTLAVRKIMDEAEEIKIRRIARSGNITAVKERQKENRIEEAADSSLAAKAKKSGISVGTLRKVYKRGVAAWNSGHRPGTTPQQWGHARVNSYINKGKTYHTADKDLREDANIDELFEMQLVGTDEYRKHAIAMTPGQADFKKVTETAKENDGVDDGIEMKPTLTTKKKKSMKTSGNKYNSTLHGMPVTARFNALESVSLEEAIQYHVENKVSFTENAFRPGSEMFFEMIKEAKRLYAEGKYSPKDDWEKDLLNSNIGEIAEFEGQTVVLDYPIEEGLEECWTGYVQKGMKKKGDKMVPNCVPVNEEDKTEGKGIGKPWREGGGGAVYVRTGDGGIKKVRFSQSGMKKKFMDPAATRSFIARHRCLTNKDKTSASYWACRYPRFFSNSGKTWW
jgi:dephospho-CoA kinase